MKLSEFPVIKQVKKAWDVVKGSISEVFGGEFARGFCNQVGKTAAVAVIGLLGWAFSMAFNKLKETR